VVPNNARITAPDDTAPDVRLSTVDASVPNVARIYDYILGGKDNFAADRAAARQLLAVFPEAREAAREGRAVIARIVEFLAREAGIRQFLDIGSGLPTQRNVHEVALAVAPDARVVYVDHDPVVCVHGRALLEVNDQVAMVEADLRRPAEILTHPATRRLLDFSQPVAILLASVLHLVCDDDDPFGAVAQLREAMAPGSYLMISHMLETEASRSDTEQFRRVCSGANSNAFPRTLDQVVRFVAGLELLNIDQFATPEIAGRFSNIGWGAIGRKP
jgi:S-adenosyl methyltransferase